MLELQGLAHVARQQQVMLQVAGTQGAVPAETGQQVGRGAGGRYWSTLL